MIGLALGSALALVVALEMIRRDLRDQRILARLRRYSAPGCIACGREIAPEEPRIALVPSSPADFGTGRSLQRHVRCR